MKKKIKKSTMRIISKKRRSSKSVTIKTIKFVRATKKMRAIARKVMKKALKGVPSMRASIYKKIDIAVSRNLQGAVEDSVLTIINGMLKPVEVKTRKTRKTQKKAKTAVEA